MKKHFVLILFSLLFTRIEAQNWTRKNDFIGWGRTSCVAFGSNANGFIGAGYDANSYKKNFWKYEPDSNWWKPITGIGGPNGAGCERNMAVAFSINGKGYVTTGQGPAPYLKDNWEYDPSTDLWTQKANFPGTARRGAVAFVIDSIGFVGTGQDANGFRADFFKYSPASNTWTPIANFPGAARRLAIAFSISGKGYVGTGDKGTLTNDFWEYNPQSNNWTSKASFPGSARQNAVGFSLAAYGYAGTGYDDNLTFTNDFWRYDPSGNSWMQLQSFPGQPRAAAAAYTAWGKAFLGTGYNNDTLFCDFWEFNPDQVPLSVHTAADVTSASVYPNPLRTVSSFKLQTENMVEGDLLLYNTAGTLTKRIPLRNNSCRIERGDLAAGIYLYTLESRNLLQHVSGKLVVAE